MKGTIFLLGLVGMLVAASGQARMAGFDEYQAIQDSLRNVPPKQRAWWLQDRGLDASYYTTYQPPDTGSGLHLVGKWGRGPSVEVTGQGNLVALALGSEAALLDFTDPARPAVLAELQLDYRTKQVALRDSLLITGGNGIQVWDISAPAHPVQLSVIPYGVFDFVIQDTLLLFASLDTFHVYDITDPANPRRVGHCPGSGYVTAATRSTAVLVRPDDRLGFIDVTDPAMPRAVGTYPGWALSAQIRGNLVCAAFADPGNQDRSWFLTLDVTDPANPRQLARLDNVCGYDMHLDGDYAILSGRYEAYEPFQVVSIADSTSPTLVGELDLPGQRWGVWTDLGRQKAYVASDGCGLAVVDMRDVTAPRLDTVVMRADQALDVWIDGTRAYVANWRGGLQIVDVQDPSRPTQLGSWDSVGATSQTAAAQDSFAFIDWRPGPQFRSVLVSDPTNPREVATLTVPSRPADMVLRDTLLYAAGRMRFYIVNVARPREPVLVGSCVGDGVAIVVQDSFAYTAAGATRITNIARPDSPYVVSTIHGRRASGIAVRDTFLYLPAAYDTVWVYSIADPALPREIGYAPMLTHLWDIALADTVAAVATVSGLDILDLADPANPRRLGGVTTPYGPRRVVWAAPYFYAAMWDAGVAIYAVEPGGLVESGDGRRPAGYLRALPNPSAGRVTLMADGLCNNDIVVRDVAGRVVLTATARITDERRAMVELDGLRPGVYFAEAKVRNRFVRVKLIIR